MPRWLAVSRLSVLAIALASMSMVPISRAVARPFVDGAWSSLPGESQPDARREYAAVYDAENARYVLFAGFTNIYGYYYLFNEIWTLSMDANPTWQQLAIPGAQPGPRHSPQWGYDAARNRVLIFGGYGLHYPNSPYYEYLNDVWQLSLDGPTPVWTELIPAGTPPSGRLAGAAVYDPLRQRFVGFGGTIHEPVDTWSLELAGNAAAWTPIRPDTTRPNAGYGMTAIYDPVRDRMVIFGGSTSDAYHGVHNHVWALSLRGEPEWTKLNPGGPLPVARRSGTAIYDPLRDRMVIYGGWDSGTTIASFLGDVWALPFETNQWDELAPEGLIPTGRDAMTAAYDPAGDRLVVFGGWSGASMLGDTQFLTWGGSGTPASMTATTDADPGVAHLQWTVENTTSSHAAVYRRTASTPWSSIATVEADPSGTITFADHGVASGGDYGYKVVVASEHGSEFGGEAWVTVPSSLDVGGGSRLGLAIGRVAPNPAFDRFTVAFALPSAERATLEVLDLSGRRVLAHEIGAPGAGQHRLELRAARDLAPGMYFLKLAQAGRSATSRIVIQGR